MFYFKNSKVICKDLNLENILVIGNLKLIDLGLSKQYKLDNKYLIRNFSMVQIAGTLLYQAIEIINNQGHNYIVDW
ncbi:unnamed protein product [Paramecium pentaurelia]|uniref:Protein kinase domain-containing protein n=1 Tax=Paramecium pentaurelia TaxID=43138 RepID=A0A8S1VDL6_9CILI|nr:unnamed protein product [Paramecium pentaurelia]